MDDEPNPARRIDDPRRVAAVASTGLVDTPPEEAFDRLTRLASDLVGAPIVFVTLVDDHVSYRKSATGIDHDARPRHNPVEESFCPFVVTTGAEQVIPDTRADGRTRGMAAVETMNIGAWAGVPVRAASGDVLGTFCAMDVRPREWTRRQLEILRTLSAGRGRRDRAADGTARGPRRLLRGRASRRRRRTPRPATTASSSTPTGSPSPARRAAPSSSARTASPAPSPRCRPRRAPRRWPRRSAEPRSTTPAARSPTTPIVVVRSPQSVVPTPEPR